MDEQDYIEDLARRITARFDQDRSVRWLPVAQSIIESALAMIALDLCAGREVRLMYLGQLKRLALPDGGDLVVRYRACDCLLDAATCPCHQEGSHERT